MLARRGDRMSIRPPRLTGSEPRSGPSFTVHVDLVDGRIRLAGPLDRSTVHLFQEAISALLLGDHDTWAIDTADLTDCDQIGVWAIGAAYRRALRHNRRMRLTGAPPPLQQSLARLRLDHHLLDGAPGAGAVPDSLPA
jgi:anti-anti-sigma regulatory factor